MLDPFIDIIELYGQGNIPRFPEQKVIDVSSTLTNIFKNEAMLLELTGDIVVVGDLHGHLKDLMQILSRFGLPPERKYLFLGDYVDRGEFCLETLLMLYLMKIVYPQNVFLIRGNHEFLSISSHCGFKDEVIHTYGSDKVFNVIEESFSQMPIAALVNDDTLCVHGGIGPRLKLLTQISSIPRPITELYGGIADYLLWSDPSEEIQTFRASSRGNGVEFGEEVLGKFLEENSLRMLVRAHQSISTGVEYIFDAKLITVFSASNYCNQMMNPCGALILHSDHTEEPIVLESLPYTLRADALFKECLFDISPKLSKSHNLLIPKGISQQRSTENIGFVKINEKKPIPPSQPYAPKRRFTINAKGAPSFIQRHVYKRPSDLPLG